jgi:hypothetical protein
MNDETKKTNLKLWESVEKTPEDLIEKVDAGDGKKLNSIPAINRFKKATEVFGVYGDKWGLKEIKHTELHINNLAIGNLQAVFFYTHNDKEISFEISNSISILFWEDGKPKANVNYRKSIETDTVTKALSKLGFNADIYSDSDLIEGTIKKDELSIDDIVKIEEG